MQISSSFEVKTLFEFSTCYIRCRNEIQSQSLEIFMEHEIVLSNHYMRIKIAEIILIILKSAVKVPRARVRCGI